MIEMLITYNQVEIDDALFQIGTIFKRVKDFVNIGSFRIIQGKMENYID